MKIGDVVQNMKTMLPNSQIHYLSCYRFPHEEPDFNINYDIKADRSVVTKHLKNIFASGESEEASVCANFAYTAEDGSCRMTLPA